MRLDVTTELKELRLLGMASAWDDLVAQGVSVVTKFAGLLVKLRDGHQIADYAQ